MRGRDGAFEEYAAARWDRLVRSAILLGLDPAAAEDLVQDALVRCYLAWDKVIRADDVDAYVHRVLINTLRDKQRRRSSTERPTELISDQPVIEPAGAAVDAVRLALLRLPIPLREVIVLRYYVDLTEAQTAAALRIPLGTVKSRGARAMALLETDPDLTVLSPGADR